MSRHATTLPPHQRKRDQPKKRGKAEPKEPAQKATESKGKAAPKEPAAKNVWTSAHSKFEMDKPMLSELDLATAGVNIKGLHTHYITHAMDNHNTEIVGEFKAEDLHSGPIFSPFLGLICTTSSTSMPWTSPSSVA